MGRALLELELDGVEGAEGLEVHRVEVREDLSAGWSVVVLARSADVALDLGGALGVRGGLRHVHLGRRWVGVCRQARLVEAVEVGDGEVGLSTYQLVIVMRRRATAAERRVDIHRGLLKLAIGLICWVSSNPRSSQRAVAIDGRDDDETDHLVRGHSMFFASLVRRETGIRK